MGSHPLKKQLLSDAMFLIFLLALAGLIAGFIICFMRGGSFSIPHAIGQLIAVGSISIIAIMSLVVAVLSERSVRKFNEEEKKKFINPITTGDVDFLITSPETNSNGDKPDASQNDDPQKKYESALKRDVARKAAWVCICSVMALASAVVLCLSMFSRGSLIFGKSYLDLPDLLHHQDIMIPMCIIAFVFLASLVALGALVNAIEKRYSPKTELLIGSLQGLKYSKPENQFSFHNLHKLLLSSMMGFPGQYRHTQKKRSNGDLELYVLPQKREVKSRFATLCFAVPIVGSTIAFVVIAEIIGDGELAQPHLPGMYWLRMTCYMIAAVLLLVGVICALSFAKNHLASIRDSTEHPQKFKDNRRKMKMASYLNNVFKGPTNSVQLLNLIKEHFSENKRDATVSAYCISHFTESGDNMQITKYFLKDSKTVEMHFCVKGEPYSVDMNFGALILEILEKCSFQFLQDGDFCEDVKNPGNHGMKRKLKDDLRETLLNDLSPFEAEQGRLASRHAVIFKNPGVDISGGCKARLESFCLGIRVHIQCVLRCRKSIGQGSKVYLCGESIDPIHVAFQSASVSSLSDGLKLK